MTNIPTLGLFQFRCFFYFCETHWVDFVRPSGKESAEKCSDCGCKMIGRTFCLSWSGCCFLPLDPPCSPPRMIIGSRTGVDMSDLVFRVFCLWTQYCLSCHVTLVAVLFYLFIFFWFDDSTRDLRPICKWFVAVALEPVYQGVSTRWSY